VHPLRAGVFDLGRGDRPAQPHLLEHPLDDLGLLGRQPRRRAPRVPVRHPPAQHRVQGDGQQRRLVPPVLEQFARRAVGRPVEQPDGVRPEPAEQRHVVRPHENVDRIHLQQTDPADHPAQVPDVGNTRRRRIGEALGAERDAARLPKGKRIGDHRR